MANLEGEDVPEARYPSDAAMEAAAERVVERALGRRDLPWADKTDAEKIETLRRELRGLRSEVEAQCCGHGNTAAKLYRLAEDFAHHRHEGKEVLVPVEGEKSFGMSIGGGPGMHRRDPLA